MVKLKESIIENEDKKGENSQLPQLKDETFESLNLSASTMNAIKKMGFEKMTEIQAQCIPLLSTGKNLIGAAKTGSGKTLAFLIPALELLHKLKFRQNDGTGVIVIAPTRELALQIYAVAKDLCAENAARSIAAVIGGSNRSQEAKKLAKNVNVIIATPGRLLDHLKNTKDFNVKNLRMLVIDEADRILDNGFEEEVKQILKLIPKDRQTALFSATQTKRTQDLIKVSFSEKPAYVGVDDDEEYSTRKGLTQGYVIVDPAEKFLVLLSFLKTNRRKKIIVFLSTCSATKYYSDLLNFVDVSVLALHGKLKQNRRTKTFFEFSNASAGVLLATDVAARGLDIPAVDWILQFDAPDSAKAYIHRVGRTARGLAGVGRALLFLGAAEEGLVAELRRERVPLEPFCFPAEKVLQVQEKLEELVAGNYYLAKAGREAFRAYLQGYAQMSDKKVFDVHSVDVFKVAKAFGFDSPPKISINVNLGGKKTRKRMLQMELEKNKAAKDNFGHSVPQFCR